MSQPVIGFLGAGQMARALAGGFVRAGLVSLDALVAHDPSPAAAELFVQELSIEEEIGPRLLDSNADVVQASQVVFLAVKPQQVSGVAREVGGQLGGERLLVSIAAGVDLARLALVFGTERIIRVMPNTPCLVGEGAAGYAAGREATQEDSELVGRLLTAVGIAFPVEERLLDAVTGLSGSGPAFVYTMIEALSDGGVRMGLPRAMATALAAQTVRGAARMVLASDDHPAVLRDRVASPGGTTIAGIQALEEHGLRAALMAAVAAATNRSIELGQQ